MAVNGDSSSESLSVNGDEPATSTGSVTVPDRYRDDPSIPDAPMPTVNGGYSHTKASRAKIAAANKGKTPWNKGKHRSEEVKARIAAGVRRKNRERLLKKIADMGLTEEEYNAQKKEEKRKKEAERRARKTEKGGYRPTQETKDKISAILKEKWARGEVKKRAPSTGQRRKGFKHSEETKQKIRDSLRERWANDPEYRAKKEESARRQNTSASSREKIAKSLKKKWEDPKFRAYMMEKMKQRKKPAKVSDEHRAKISEAMKKKWQDEKYRTKTVDNIRKAAARNVGSRPATAGRKSAAVQATKPMQRELKNGIIAMMPEMASTKKTKKKVAKRKTNAKAKETTKTKTTAKASATTKPKKNTAAQKKKAAKAVDKEPDDLRPIEAVKPLTQPKRVFEDLEDDDDDNDGVLDDFGGNGDLAQLRHERRDLFDLLYGDDDMGANDAAIYDKQAAAAPMTARKAQVTTSPGPGRPTAAPKRVRVPANAEESDTLAAVAAAAGGAMPRADRRNVAFSPSLPSFSFDDDDDEDDSLDNFDPYGLEDGC